MPLYEYHCPACRSRFEVLVRSTTSVTCPKCGGTGAEKLLSTFATTVTKDQPRCPGSGRPGPGCAGGGNAPCAGGSCPFS